MKTNSTTWFIILIAFFLLFLSYLAYIYINKKPIEPVIINHVEYRNSPKIDSLKNVIDTLQKSLIEKRKVFYKYLTVYKDTGSTVIKEVHDSIIFLANDVFQTYDSIICQKDSIISDLTNTLKLTRDSVNYYRVLCIDEKTKKKTWKWVSAASLLLNGVLILKI